MDMAAPVSQHAQPANTTIVAPTSHDEQPAYTTMAASTPPSRYAQPTYMTKAAPASQYAQPAETTMAAPASQYAQPAYTTSLQEPLVNSEEPLVNPFVSGGRQSVSQAASLSASQSRMPQPIGSHPRRK